MNAKTDQIIAGGAHAHEETRPSGMEIRAFRFSGFIGVVTNRMRLVLACRPKLRLSKLDHTEVEKYQI